MNIKRDTDLQGSAAVQAVLNAHEYMIMALIALSGKSKEEILAITVALMQESARENNGEYMLTTIKTPIQEN